MKLYLVNAENIYFPQIKDYFREIISSYDNGNYRSAMVMLYSTIVCDLILKLKELSDVYNDAKAEKLLEEINRERKQSCNSTWEWKLIEAIRERTELLSDESYAMIEHIYDLRNFSAHPALNEDYELISPTPEMTVAYIKKALDDIFIRPSVFAESIVNRMSDDIAERKEQYQSDFEAFELYLNKVYFQRMSTKMVNQVFKAFWKFTFIKEEDEPFEKNRHINRKLLEAMLNKYHGELCDYIEQNSAYFTVSANPSCMRNVCVVLAYFPNVYNKLDETVKDQIEGFVERDIIIIKWFESGNLESHLNGLRIRHDVVSPKILKILEKICKKQGQPNLFVKFLIDHYSLSNSYASARDRFDAMIEPYLKEFCQNDFIRLIQMINDNDQIYNYSGQKSRNDKILDIARPILPINFDFSCYENFKFTEDVPDYAEPDSAELSSNNDDSEIPF